MSKYKDKLYEGEILRDFRELVARYENRFSSKPAFIYKKEPKATEHVSILYSQFVQDIKSLATSLLDMELENKKVALIAPNRYEWCVSYLAVTTANITIIPLDKSLPNNEIKSLIIRSKADAVIFDHKYLPIFEEINAENSSSLTQYICMDDISSTNISSNHFFTYSSLVEKGRKLYLSGNMCYEDISLDPDKASILLFTSGTTAISKCVGLSQANICSDIYALSQMTDIRKEDVFLSFLPLHHTFESTCTFLYGTSCGITVAFCDGLKYVQKNLIEFQITGFVGVPLMLEVMYKKIEKGVAEQGKTKLVKIMRKVCNFLLKFGIDIRSKVFKQILNQFGGKLHTLIAGGAPMNKETVQGFVDLGINLLQGYGLTETSPVVAGENDKFKRAGSVGFPLPGITVQIAHPDQDGIGEIMVKGPTVMKGYIDNEEATKEVLKDGWFYTGDLGRFDKDGFLFITGRKKDVIVLKNGKNIFPEELEILINSLPYVSESIVYGKPAKDNDLMICSKIVYNPETIKELYPGMLDYKDIIWKDVKEKINHSMPAYKAIREIIVTEEPLIKTTTQKIKRHEELKRILGD